MVSVFSGLCAAHSASAQSTDGQIVIWGAVVDPDPLNPGVNWVPPGRFKQVATGWTFTLFLVSHEDPLENGKIIARGSMWPSTGTPGTPTGPGHKAVAAGYNHALAIDQHDEIVAWGYAEPAALAPGVVPPDLQGAKVSAIAAGENLSAAILMENVTKASASAGDIVVWGMSEAHYAGTIGVPGSYSVLEGPFAELSAHGHHMIARRESGELFAWGMNLYPLVPTADPDDGQVFRVNENPVHPVTGQPWGSFSAGHWHSVVLDANGVWHETAEDDSDRWGRHKIGQAQGTYRAGPYQPPAPYQPPPLDVHTEGLLVASDQVERGYFHVTLVTKTGRLIAWGRNDDDQCVVPTTHDGYPLRALTVSSAFNHSAAMLTCYANCDRSTTSPVLTANDLQCFLNAYAAGDVSANCDLSTGSPMLTANDFQCFLNAYAQGCS